MVPVCTEKQSKNVNKMKGGRESRAHNRRYNLSILGNSLKTEAKWKILLRSYNWTNLGWLHCMHDGLKRSCYIGLSNLLFILVFAAYCPQTFDGNVGEARPSGGEDIFLINRSFFVVLRYLYCFRLLILISLSGKTESGSMYEAFSWQTAVPSSLSTLGMYIWHRAKRFIINDPLVCNFTLLSSQFLKFLCHILPLTSGFTFWHFFLHSCGCRQFSKPRKITI